MKAPFNLKTHKADVLSCLQIFQMMRFHSPKLANQMLDLIESSCQGIIMGKIFGKIAK